MTRCTRALLVAAALAAGGLSSALAAEQRRPICLSQDETRQAMQARQMVQPVRAVEAALRLVSGESVGIRLCHEDAAMFYDVAVLRHDGHLIHVLIDAGSGTPLPSRVGQ